MNRRSFLRKSLVGLAAATLESAGVPGMLAPPAAEGAPAPIALTMAPALVEMIDGTQVFMWTFTDASGPHFPGPVITVRSGQRVQIALTNALDELHAFTVPGVVSSGPILPGRTRLVTFTAPAGGTYLYFDPLNAPVNRVLGLHGAMVVLPAAGNTPYTRPTPAVQQLFDDLGVAPQVPGDAWLAPPANRSRLWLFSQTDPRFNAQAQAGQTINAAKFVAGFVPDYFTINGLSGAFASHDPAIFPSGNIGEPHLIRILNAGVATHSPHQHANHIYILSVTGVVQGNVLFIDTFTVRPLDRVDWLLPFVRPPDIAGDPRTPLRDLLPQELALVLGNVPQSPLSWPMHCHMEQSQTALGGNYPQGLVAHMEIVGYVDKVPFPNQPPPP